jgi:hypothetical protein
MNWKAKLARAFFLLTLVIVSMIGAVWRIGVASAQQFPESQIELRTDNAPVVGQPYVVDIFANIAAPAYGFGVQVKYDPTVLQLDLQQDRDTTFVPLRVGGVFVGAQRIRNNQATDGTMATVDAVYTLLPPAEPVQGEGFIGRVTFTVLQAAPAQVELVSPRLIALDNGTALDMPLVMGQPLLLNQDAVPVAASPVTVEAAPVVQVVETAPSIVEAPVVENVLATVDTPRDVLDQMARTSTIMNAVAIGLLFMMGLMLAVMTISTFMDALEGAKSQRSMVRAYAYAARSAAQVNQRTVVDSYRVNERRAPAPDDTFARAMTIPSRTVQMRRLMSVARRKGPDTNDL